MRKIISHLAWSVFTFALSLFVGMLVLINVTWMRWEEAERPELHAAIILGNRLQNGQPSPTLMARLEKAQELYDAKLVSILVLSGGIIGDEETSEAQVMKSYLVQRGLPDTRLILETQSTSTIDNLYYSKLLIDSLDCEPVYLVTSKSHLCRAMMIAERCGVDARGVPAEMAGSLPEIWAEYAYEALRTLYFLAFEQWELVNPDKLPDTRPELKYASLSMP
ncbi:MAG: YdcF family protein [Chloroherpetonaceae bacterium]|nr:YdcF family protein [Chloroherpetonaceae bacterium]MCS7211831.1 YdcF family protein [Chloroherpetonaceae bacterium]MDW8019580.1 YdcF family protein [Chloroherpetonaceae bacterium]